MSSVAEQIAESLAPTAHFDPADADSLGDETIAGRRKRRTPEVSVEPTELPQEKRLRLRAGLPVLSKYKGKKVSRKEMFGGGDDDEAADIAGKGSDEDQQGSAAESEADGGMTHAVAGGLSISADLEAEYDKLMKQASKDIEVMHKPSQKEVTKRETDAKALKRQLDAWSSLVEFRIHLEGLLTMGHRLPTGAAAASFREADAAVASEGESVAKELQGLMGELQVLQGRLMGPRPLRKELLKAPEPSARAPAGGEPAVWAALDGRVKEALQWSLDVADDWKEKTRLDTRRSFKVLDQSLRVQMQAVQEVDADKLRKRCTPPPGKHKVFGTAASSSTAEAQDAEPDAGEGGIYDDREFYVQLLREVLSSGGDKAGASKQIQAEIQGRRASKKKAKVEVERRASKGRKIRFVPIEKLQNFMAPRPRFSTSAADAGAEGQPLLSSREEEGQAPALLREGAVEALLRSIFAPPVRGG